MFRIFKTVRKKLIEQDKIRDYLLYALGEIFLVVAGIVIALQLHNWNDKRIERRKFEEQLISVQQELTDNIKAISLNYQTNTIADSLCNLVLSDTLTASDYRQSGRKLLELILHAPLLQIKTNEYENLVSDFNEIPEGYDKIISSLEFLDALNKSFITTAQNTLIEIVFNEIDFLKKSFPSFRYIRQNKQVGKKYMQYLLTNPIYKNKVADYQHFVRDNLSRIALLYQYYALETNKKIAAKVENKLPGVLVPEKFYESVSPQKLKKYAGIYEIKKIETNGNSKYSSSGRIRGYYQPKAKETIEFIFADNKLYKQNADDKVMLKAFSENRFFIPEEYSEVRFDKNGAFVQFAMNASIFETYYKVKIDRTIKQEK